VSNEVLDNVRAIVSAVIQRLAGLSDLTFLGKNLQTYHMPQQNLQCTVLNALMSLSDKLSVSLVD